MNASREVNRQRWRGVRLAYGDDALPTDKYRLSAANNAGAVVSVGIASTTLLAANASRLSFILKNIGTVTVYVKFGAAAALTNFPLAVNEVLEGDDYTGIITAIIAVGTNDVAVMEV
jgi:hypothetical protein